MMFFFIGLIHRVYCIFFILCLVVHGSGEYLDFLNTLSTTSDFPTGRWKKANSSTDGAYEPVTSVIKANLKVFRKSSIRSM